MVSTILTIAGALALTAAVVLMFRPWPWAALVAYAGLWLMVWSGHIVLSPAQLVFWGVAAALVAGINFLLPAEVVASRRGVAYIAGAALAGTLVGMLASGAGMIVGSVVGAACGALAYSRTPSGRDIVFPSRPWLNYLAAKGLPAVVTCCIIGIVVALLASQYYIINNLQ